MATDTTSVPKVKCTECGQCGMVVHPAEYHPYAACLMFQSCKDGEVVRANLDAVRRAQPAPAASPAPAYRLLERGRDTIQADDEFLREDGVTWRKDPSGIFVGCTYEGNILLPARRAITAAHGIKEQ